MKSLIFQIEWLGGRRNSNLMGEADVESDRELATMVFVARYRKTACSTIYGVIRAPEVGSFSSPVVVERGGRGHGGARDDMMVGRSRPKQAEKVDFGRISGRKSWRARG